MLSLRRTAIVALVTAYPLLASAERTYVAPGSELWFSYAEVPDPALLIGEGIGAVVAGAPAQPIHGAVDDAAVPRAWYLARPDAVAGMQRQAAPLDPEPTDAARVAALYAVRTFEVGDELSALRVLHLRARYADGIAVWINGREVVRRGLDPGDPAAFAERPRGPEWETFVIPVVPGLLARGDNALAIEVRPSARATAPSLDVELVAASSARIVRGPIVQRVGRDRATIAFHTDMPATGAVELEVDGQDPRRVASAGGALAAHHVVELDALPPGGAVRYRVVAGADASAWYAFHTAPADTEVVRIAIYGDMRNGHDVHAAIATALVREAPDMVLVTGDLVARGSDHGDWERFFAITRELLPRVPYYPAAGNHDLGYAGAEQRRMNEIFALWPGPDDRPPWASWYSFTVAGVHVVMLDSNAYERAEQLAWLERDLAAAREAGVRAIVAVTHDGPYSRGPHGGDELAATRYAPVLAAHGVTLLAAGHDHIYQRGEVEGLRYVVSGGGGAPLYPIRCQRRCEDGAQHVAREHHYLMLTVYPGHVEMCPKLPDGTPLEACVRWGL